MNKAAIIHKATREYCFPVRKNTFCIRAETQKNDVREIVLHTRDKYLPAEKYDTRRTFVMQRTASDEARDYYEAQVDIDLICLRYFFEITDITGSRLFFGDDRFSESMPEDIEDMFDCPQTMREEGFPEIPEWAAGKVVYQIFPSRFAPTGEIDENEWYRTPIGLDDRLGGSIKGITGKLGYIKELGADIIYLTPVFDSETQHHYDTKDYYRICPELGTEQDLKELVEKAHGCGLRVILDGVFNHTSADFFAFRDIRVNGESSEYRNWYHIDRFPVDMGGKDKLPGYKAFAYYGGMPKLDLTNEETADYITDVVCRYIREFDIDGWRLDVGDEIGHLFWKKLRLKVKKIKPDALLAGEAWHICGDFLEGDEWDSCMNYAWYKAIRRLYSGGRIGDFIDTAGKIRGRYHGNVFAGLWNLIGSHDTSRFISEVCGGDRRILLSAAAITMLFPGAPFICYGDEVGIGGLAPFDNRRGMLWGDRADKHILNVYKSLTAFRHAHPELWRELPEVLLLDEERRLLVLRQQDLVIVAELSGNDVRADSIDILKEMLAENKPEMLLTLSGSTDGSKIKGFDVLTFKVNNGVR